MANIANLSVQLTLQTANFQKKLTSSQQQMVGMTKTVGALGKSITGLGIALGVGLATSLALAAKQGADFEESIVRMGSIVNATEALLGTLGKVAREFGEDTVFSAVQSAEAMREFSQAGFTVDQTLKALGPTLNFAVAGLLSISEAADIAARVMFSMGLEAEDLNDSLEVLTKAFTLAPVSVMELGEAFKFVGPVGRAAGKDIQELTSFLVIFARAGLRGEQAGTALRNILLRLQVQPSEVKKALASLNVTIADSEGKMRALADILEDISLATENMTAVEKQAIISKIAGIRATAAFSAAMNTGAEAIRDIERELRINSGTMDRLAKNQLTTLTSKVLLLKSAMVEFGITINDVFGVRIKKAIDKITDFVKTASDLVQENEKMTKSLVIGAAGLSAITVAAGLVITAFAALTITFIIWNAVGLVAIKAAAVMAAAFLAGAAVVGIWVLALVAAVLAINNMVSGMSKAKGALMVLNQETKLAVSLQKSLARTQTNLINLQKAWRKAFISGNILAQMKAELAMIKEQQEATAIRIVRAKELLRVRERLGAPTGGDQRAIAKLNSEMRELVANQERLNSLIIKQTFIDQQIRQIKGDVLREQQNIILSDFIQLKLLQDRQKVWAEMGLIQAKSTQIQRDAVEQEAKFAEMVAKSNRLESEKKKILSDIRREIKFTAELRQQLLDDQNRLEVAMFLATEQEKAAIALAMEKKRLLGRIKGLKDEEKLRIAIEKKFLIKAADLKKQFAGEGDQAAAAPTGPGALIAGTVEAFKAAFRQNPALDEAKKQTKEQMSISKTVRGILKNTAGLADANTVHQIIIAD